MSNLKRYKILICHLDEAPESEYCSLKRWLNEAPYFYWQEVTTSVTDFLHIEDKKVTESDCVIILPETYENEDRVMLQRITSFAISAGKPIIDIQADDMGKEMSDSFKLDTTCVKCSLKNVVNVIRKYAL